MRRNFHILISPFITMVLVTAKQQTRELAETIIFMKITLIIRILQAQVVTGNTTERRSLTGRQMSGQQLEAVDTDKTGGQSSRTFTESRIGIIL